MSQPRTPMIATANRVLGPSWVKRPRVWLPHHRRIGPPPETARPHVPWGLL